MTPAASALKEKIIAQSAIGGENHIFGAIKREIETPNDPHTLSSLINSIAAPEQQAAPKVSASQIIESAVPTRGLIDKILKKTTDYQTEASSFLSSPIVKADPAKNFTFHLVDKKEIEEEKVRKSTVQKSIEAGIKRREEDALFLKNQEEREIKEA